MGEERTAVPLCASRRQLCAHTHHGAVGAALCGTPRSHTIHGRANYNCLWLPKLQYRTAPLSGLELLRADLLEMGREISLDPKCEERDPTARHRQSESRAENENCGCVCGQLALPDGMSRRLADPVASAQWLRVEVPCAGRPQSSAECAPQWAGTWNLDTDSTHQSCHPVKLGVLPTHSLDPPSYKGQSFAAVSTRGGHDEAVAVVWRQ